MSDTNPTVWAVYRLYYGEATIVPSINSIYPHVSKVLIYWADKPWGGINEVEWEGKRLPIPSPIDNALYKVLALNYPLVEIEYDYFPSPGGQTKHIMDKVFGRPDHPDAVIYMQTDHVLKDADKAIKEYLEQENPYATLSNTYLWKTPQWKLDRYPHVPSSLLVKNAPFPAIEHNKSVLQTLRPTFLSNGHCYNCGYLNSDWTIFWRYLIRKEQVKRVFTDSAPLEGWYKNVWLPWKETDTDLTGEFGENLKVVPYPQNELPESLRTLKL